MLWAVLATSLVGSVHCLAMCGPLIGLARAPGKLALVHALGRLTTYVALGVAAGTIGSALDLAGHLGAMQRVAALISGGLILAWGGYQLALARGWATARPRARAAIRLLPLRTRSAAKRAWLMGVLTGMLPCGWLWAFVLAAAGTGGPLAGAATMAVFWLGTVPAMVGLLALAGPVVEALRRRMPAVTAVVLIALGVGTLATRWRDAGAAGVAHPHCHEVR